MNNDVLQQLANILGKGDILTGAAVAAYEFPWETHSECRARAIVFPRSTEQVAAVLKLCNQLRQPVVPFGGTTNLVQGCATSDDDIVLSLARMNEIEQLDVAERTLTAQAGMTMQAAQEAAAAAGLYFPLDIGARSNCTLGGIVSTNAGGTKVIRYGMTRDSVLGLEVVLADGTVLTSMNRFIKNNSGFDLKQMFVGSEGVLGIVTRVVFRLASKPTTQHVALLAADSFEKVVEMLAVAQGTLPGTLTGFEVMWNSFYERAVVPRGRLPAPIEPGACCYVLIESMGTDTAHDQSAFEALLETLIDEELIVDGVMAKSDREQADIWAIRDEVEPVLKQAHNFDVSLRSADAGKYLEALVRKIPQRVSNSEVVGFGHLGDNNLHVSVQLADHSAEQVRTVEEIVYDELRPFNGAISAEHGIGIEKRAYLHVTRSDAEIALMEKLKRTLDPNNILNPGKIVSIT